MEGKGYGHWSGLSRISAMPRARVELATYLHQVGVTYCYYKLYSYFSGQLEGMLTHPHL
jgi:hypothetical protein